MSKLWITILFVVDTAGLGVAVLGAAVAGIADGVYNNGADGAVVDCTAPMSTFFT